MSYKITGYGDSRDKENIHDPRGVSLAESLADLPEHIAWALWMDKCRYVTVEAEVVEKSLKETFNDIVDRDYKGT